MRLVSSLCKYCSRDNKDCPHYQAIRAAISRNAIPVTLTFHCKEYYEIIPLNTDVEVQLHEVNVWVSMNDPGDCGAEWVSAGWVGGVVIGPGRKGFMQIKLNEPAELCLPEQDGYGKANDWMGAEYREVTHWSKRVKDIIIKEEACPKK